NSVASCFLSRLTRVYSRELKTQPFQCQFTDLDIALRNRDEQLPLARKEEELVQLQVAVKNILGRAFFELADSGPTESSGFCHAFAVRTPPSADATLACNTRNCGLFRNA